MKNKEMPSLIFHVFSKFSDFRMKQHILKPENPPILILSEGTCSNNTAVMQFKKGAFEITNIIHPIAIKYDMRFANAFWDSRKYSVIEYMILLMTSWGIVGDVWYLPPIERKENESSVDFANRVKRVIADKVGLKESEWDGQLKRKAVKEEWKEAIKQEVAEKIMRKL
jgi:glycerol-3-phosphate O-acyltransferase 3/4